MAGKLIVQQEDSVRLMEQGHKALKEEGIASLHASVGTEALTKTSVEGCQLHKQLMKQWDWESLNNRWEQLS